jgi:hypothetical protein
MTNAAALPALSADEIVKLLPKDHPRVMLRPADVQRFRRLAATTHVAERDALLALADSARTGDVLSSNPAGCASRLALLYLITGDREHASLVSAALERMLATPVDAEYFPAQQRLSALARAYDWCHEALDPLLRDQVGHFALAHVHALHANQEIYPENYAAGHEINMIPHALAAAIGIGDEIYGASPMLVHMLERLKKMMACYRVFLDGESFNMSYPYTCAYLGDLALSMQACSVAFGRDLFAENPWYGKFVQWWNYAFRGDQTFIRYGDYFCSYPVLENYAYFAPFAVAAKHYRDPLAQWWTERFRVPAGYELGMFLFHDRESPPAAKPPTSLKRTKLFAPMGVAIARGDWENGTVAALKCSPIYLHNHCHRDQNQLTVYHKGDLAIDSGAYDSYETPHWYNYYIRTIAHNTIVVHDPTERFDSRGKVYANDGGQRFINQPQWAPRIFEHLKDPAFVDGRIAAYQEGDGWSYVCGDASNCYSKTKLTRFLRHTVFVLDWPRPGSVTLVVLDDIEVAREGLFPRFLLHSVGEPEVGAGRVVIRQDRGRLTTTFLRPQAVHIEPIGGPGKEFWVDGQNYPLKGELRGPHIPGAWRVEASPEQPVGKSFTFLTVLNPCDADAPAEPTPTVVERDGALIVEQGDLAVVLSRGAAPKADHAKRVIEILLRS